MCSRAWWLQQLLAHRFSCPEMRYFPRPRIHSMSLHWWADSQPLDQQGSLSFSLCNLPVSFFKKYKFIYFNWGLITLQYCIGFAIHQHESATGVPVSFINCWYTTLPHIWCTIEIFPFVIFTFLIAIFSFLLKEVLLTFIIKLVCWSWTSLVFACLKNSLSHLQIWK